MHYHPPNLSGISPVTEQMPMVWRYIREGNLFRESAAAKVGL